MAMLRGSLFLLRDLRCESVPVSSTVARGTKGKTVTTSSPSADLRAPRLASRSRQQGLPAVAPLPSSTRSVLYTSCCGWTGRHTVSSMNTGARSCGPARTTTPLRYSPSTGSCTCR
ncbi:hypothetical protein GSI_03195 [Ganoderma sinense ZZ0214-1]|uniref:Uncharacterized protein n=1 Tax=Ganoderma sinense ZZ0214-1 TaxID=1077348 RepID=A0A2G8SKY7_9APHY|nr:hypothetical protein GSI_03195 [Ganoderma sinense ZZ0214-1]